MGNINTTEKDINKYKSDIKNMISVSRNKHIYENINQIIDINEPFLFFKYTPQIINNSFELPDNVDFILYIYSTKDDIIEIILNDVKIITQKLIANEYFILKTNIIPICSLYYSTKNKINILSETHGDFHIVCSNVYYELREFLKKNIVITNVFDGKNESRIIYSRGQLFKDDTEIKNFITKWENFDCVIEIPNFYLSSEEYRKYLANKISKDIYYELQEIALNPNRIRSFLSIDEIKKYLN